jgi:hypothetical protein
MIALTDVGIAHLMAAARAVDRRDRRRWLQAVADEFDPRPGAARRAAGNARTARCSRLICARKS